MKPSTATAPKTKTWLATKPATLAALCLCVASTLPCLAARHSQAEINPQSLHPVITFESPMVPAWEGYATDGKNHYIFGVKKISEYNQHWQQTQLNGTALAGLPSGVNHIGGGAYYHGKLYAPVEHYAGCQDVADQTIAIYEAHQKGLPLIAQKSVARNGQEISAVTIDGKKNELYTSSYCSGAKLMVYNLKTLQLERTIPLSKDLSMIQGISWNPKYKEFALAYDGPDSKVGYLSLVSASGKVSKPIFATAPLGELEGIDWTKQTKGEIRYAIAGHIYSLDLKN